MSLYYHKYIVKSGYPEILHLGVHCHSTVSTLYSTCPLHLGHQWSPVQYDSCPVRFSQYWCQYCLLDPESIGRLVGSMRLLIASMGGWAGGGSTSSESFSFAYGQGSKVRGQLNAQCWLRSAALQSSITIWPPFRSKHFPLGGFLRRFSQRGQSVKRPCTAVG